MTRTSVALGPILLVLALAFLLGVPTLPLAFAPSVRPAAAVPGHLTVFGGGLSAGDWPTFLHDSARTGGASNLSGLAVSQVPNLTQAWRYGTGGIIAASPIVVNDTVYIGSWDGREYAINASSGAVRWSTFIGQSSTVGCGPSVRGVTSTATYSRGVIYVGGGDAQWFALNASNGKVLWNFTTGNPLSEYNWGSPLIVGDTAYVGLASACDSPLIRGALLEVNLTSRSVTNTFYTTGVRPPGASIWGSPTYDASDGVVFAATGNGWYRYPYLYAQALLSFNASNVSQLAGSYAVPKNATGPDSDFGNTPTLAHDALGNPIVAVANKNGILYAFNATNVSRGPVWTDRLAVGGGCPTCAQGSISPAAFDGQYLYAAGGRTTIGGVSYRGAVRQIDPGNGTFGWQHGFPAVVLAATTVASGYVVVEAGRILYVLNSTNGRTMFSFPTGGPIYGAPALADGCIYFGSTDDHVYALEVRGHGCGPIFPGGQGPGVVGAHVGTSGRPVRTLPDRQQTPRTGLGSRPRPGTA